jgi:hypothetical protein
MVSMMNDVELKNGSYVVRISETSYGGDKRYLVVFCVNYGETAVRSNRYKTFKGAERAAQKWFADRPQK